MTFLKIYHLFLEHFSNKEIDERHLSFL